MWTEILIVDEDPACRCLARGILRREGYATREAATALEALLIAANEIRPVDLLLTEVRLSGIDGCKLAAKITQAFPATRVMYMSGKAEAQELRDSALLLKPLQPVDLLGAVKRILGSTSPRKEPASARMPAGYRDQRETA